MARCVILAILLVLAAATDTTARKVSNIITVTFAVFGFLINCCSRGIYGIADSAAGWLLPVLLLYILYAASMLGAGDIKLLAAVGAIMGARFVLVCSAFSFIAGGIIALPLLVLRKNGLQRFSYFAAYCKSCFYTGCLQEYQQFHTADPKSVFRFSYAVVCGALITIVLQSL